MFLFLSFKNLLFKKMPINYNGYYALFLYFIFMKYKIFLFIQKNQLIWVNVIKSLSSLNLNNNYIQINSSIIKLLIKVEKMYYFFFREFIVIFFNDNLLIDAVLLENKLYDYLIFMCYNSLFINTKYLDVASKLLKLFTNNFNTLKINIY